MQQENIDRSRSNTIPGGLIAIAIINFVLAAFTFIVLVMELTNIGRRSRVHVEIMFLGSAITLLIAGVGYLTLKKNIGRYLGSIWAIVIIMINFITMMGKISRFHHLLSDMFTFIILSVYPITTLYLLNVTYKKDLVK